MMGNKVNPIAFRLGKNVIYWKNQWCCTDKKLFREYIFDDYLVRDFVEDFYREKPGITSIVIRRAPRFLGLTIYAEKVNIIVGNKGSMVERLTQGLYQISIAEYIKITVEQSERLISAYSLCNALSLEIAAKRNFKKTLRLMVRQLEQIGIIGYKIVIEGRLNGANKTRDLKLQSGKVPLQSYDYDIDYHSKPTKTSFGIIVINIWLCYAKSQKERYVS